MKQKVAILLLLMLCPIFALAADTMEPWQTLETLNWELFEQELEKGYFGSWSTEEQYAWQQKEIEAGYTPSEGLLGLPNEKSIKREEAIDMAKEAFGAMLTEGHSPIQEYILDCRYIVDDAEKPIWKISFCFPDEFYHVQNTVKIDAYGEKSQTLTVQHFLGISLEEAWKEPEEISEEENARRVAIGETLNAREESTGKRFHKWSIEEKYAWQEYELAEGVNNWYCYALPEEDDIPLGEAVALAMKACEKKYGVADITADRYAAYVEFLAAENQAPLWIIALWEKTEAGSETISYTVNIDAETGKLLYVYKGEHGWG